MTVAALLEAAGFTRRDGRPDAPLVAPDWAPQDGQPPLPTGLAWALENGHVLRAICADREKVMNGWRVARVRRYHNGEAFGWGERYTPAWAWVVSAHDAARAQAHQDGLDAKRLRREARRAQQLPLELA